MTPSETREVIDLCYQCQLCYNHCPYHPPHEWKIDFPKLMGRAKIIQAQEEGISLAERVGMRQDLLGRIGCLTSAMTNSFFRNRAFRTLMEKGTGIDRRWNMPKYAKTPYTKSIRSGAARSEKTDRVALFTTCFVEYADFETAEASVQVLEHNGVAVDQGYEMCCGAPFLHGGDLDNARKNAARVVEKLAPRIKDGLEIVIPGPTCSLQIKREYPELLDTDDSRLVSEHSYDIGEYLFKLAREDKLMREFPVALGTIAYHLPCHLKSQNIGFRSHQLLRAAGASKIEMLDQCSGVDGTWGMKARWYDKSLKIADKLAQGITKMKPDHVASDCPLSALRIHEITGHKVVHPIVLIRDAYGLQDQA